MAVAATVAAAVVAAVATAAATAADVTKPGDRSQESDRNQDQKGGEGAESALVGQAVSPAKAQANGLRHPGSALLFSRRGAWPASCQTLGGTDHRVLWSVGC